MRSAIANQGVVPRKMPDISGTENYSCMLPQLMQAGARMSVLTYLHGEAQALGVVCSRAAVTQHHVAAVPAHL